MAVNRMEKVKLNITKVSKWKPEIDPDDFEPDFEPTTEFGPDDIPDHGGRRQYNYSQNLIDI